MPRDVAVAPRNKTLSHHRPRPTGGLPLVTPLSRALGDAISAAAVGPSGFAISNLFPPLETHFHVLAALHHQLLP